MIKVVFFKILQETIRSKNICYSHSGNEFCNWAFPSCHKAKETWFFIYNFFLDPKTVYLEALVYFDFFVPNPLDFKHLTFLSFVRGLRFFYFVIRDQFVGRQTGFFSKETIQKLCKASSISVSTLYSLFCYEAGDTNCRVSLFWTRS